MIEIVVHLPVSLDVCDIPGVAVDICRADMREPLQRNTTKTI